MLISLVQQMPVIERILIYSYDYLQLFLRSCCVIILSVSMYPILILTDYFFIYLLSLSLTEVISFIITFIATPSVLQTNYCIENYFML